MICSCFFVVLGDLSKSDLFRYNRNQSQWNRKESQQNRNKIASQRSTSGNRSDFTSSANIECRCRFTTLAKCRHTWVRTARVALLPISRSPLGAEQQSHERASECNNCSELRISLHVYQCFRLFLRCQAYSEGGLPLSRSFAGQRWTSCGMECGCVFVHCRTRAPLVAPASAIF
jgi:hypothetical protein